MENNLVEQMGNNNDNKIARKIKSSNKQNLNTPKKAPSVFDKK